MVRGFVGSESNPVIERSRDFASRPILDCRLQVATSVAETDHATVLIDPNGAGCSVDAHDALPML